MTLGSIVNNRGWLLLWVSFFATTGVFGQVTPVNVSFGDVGVGKTATKNIVVRNTTAARMAVSSITLEPPNAAFSLGLPAGNSPWNVGTELTFEVTYRPIKTGSFVTSARIVLAVGSERPENSTRIVEISGSSRCGGKDDRGNEIVCDPVRPMCVVSDNEDTRLVFPVKDFFKTVGPAFDDISARQARYTDFTMPVTFLWGIIGLEQLIPKPNIECCEREIHFKHVKGSATESTFIRTSATDIVVNSKLPAGLPTISIKVPMEISGRAYIAGTYTEFLFDSGKAPYLTINDSGALLYDGEITCFNAGFSKAVVRHAKPGPKPPQVHIVIK